METAEMAPSGFWVQRCQPCLDGTICLPGLAVAPQDHTQKCKETRN